MAIFHEHETLISLHRQYSTHEHVETSRILDVMDGL